MIATLLSFQAIEIAITSQVDPSSHVVLEQRTASEYLVVKDGIALRKLFEEMMQIKDAQIDPENATSHLSSPLFVCLSPKSRKVMQPVFAAICPSLESHLLYFNTDKAGFRNVLFNRAWLRGREICFGEGLSQLRPKQELRIALSSLLKPFKKVEYIFIEKYKQQVKQLKKDGFTNIIESLDPKKYQQVFKNINQKVDLSLPENQLSLNAVKLIQSYPFASQYIRSFAIGNGEIKNIQPFSLKKISIQGFVDRLISPSTYYNITPKSWVNKTDSKEISSYVFHSSSDNHLYVARASRPRQFTNEEEVELRILAYYLSYLINPEGYAVPHDKTTALMKFSKIKKYENKGTFFNVRSYIEGLATIYQLLQPDQYMDLISKGQIYGNKVKGLGGVILTSWIINEEFTTKSLSQQVCLIGKHADLHLLHSQQIKEPCGELSLCRTDFFSVFNMSNYKVLEDTFLLARLREQALSINLSQLYPGYIAEMCELLSSISEERIAMIKGLFLHFRWHTKLVYYFDLFAYRLQAIRQYLTRYHLPQPTRNPSLLLAFPQLACLLVPENYDYFMLPLSNAYYPLDLSYQDTMAEDKLNQNPYLSYMHKTCSFVIQNLSFPTLSFLQWVKATGKYHVIEYISMIKCTFQDYLVLDKRLKMVSVNEKKNVVLIVDHAQCCQDILKRPKSVKTVFIFRLRKPVQNEDLGVISADVEKKATLEDSEDELIRILYRWGELSQSFPSRFQLYDWVFTSYRSVKCNHYGLSEAENKDFVGILHKAIATNRHRLKELEQTHKNLWKHLYCYPIYKEGQKILFNYRLFEFIHVKNLFTSILEGTWNFKLQTYQNASVNLWKSLIDPALAANVAYKIIEILKTVSLKKMDADQFKAETYDSLELIKSLTQRPEKVELLDDLYFQVFTNLVKIENYSSLQTTLLVDEFIVVVDESNIEISKGIESLKITKEAVRTITFQRRDNALVFLSYDTVVSEFYINQLELVSTPVLGYTKVISQAIKNELAREFLSKAQWQLCKIHKNGNRLAIALALDNRLIIIVLGIFDQQICHVGEFSLEKNILDLYFTPRSSQLLVITSEKVLKYSLDNGEIDSVGVELFKVDFGITKTLVYELQDKVHVYLYKLHIIQHYVIDKGQVIVKWRYQLGRNINTIAVQRQLLYVFYENCDALDIMLLHEGQLQKLWTYFWVEPNCQALHVRGQDLFLRGNGYLKQVRVRNSQALQKQMMEIQ